jgi:isopentenyl phosphate kinase
VALDAELGGTIVSTEELLAFLARRLRPARLILIGDADGVFEQDPHCGPAREAVPLISAANWAQVRAMLGGSHATDVTGGMLAKIELAVELVRDLPGLVVHVASGDRPGALEALLAHPEKAPGGTIVRWEPAAVQFTG